jgi:hypothetical protein
LAKVERYEQTECLVRPGVDGRVNHLTMKNVLAEGYILGNLLAISVIFALQQLFLDSLRLIMPEFMHL